MTTTLEVELPDDLAHFRFPQALADRLPHLLELQESGQALSPYERREAEALVEVADLFTLLQLRAT